MHGANLSLLLPVDMELQPLSECSRSFYPSWKNHKKYIEIQILAKYCEDVEELKFFSKNFTDYYFEGIKKAGFSFYGTDKNFYAHGWQIEQRLSSSASDNGKQFFSILRKENAFAAVTILSRSENKNREIMDAIISSLKITSLFGDTISFPSADSGWEIKLPYAMHYKINYEDDQMDIVLVTSKQEKLVLTFKLDNNLDDANWRYQHLRNNIPQDCKMDPINESEINLGIWTSAFYKMKQSQNQELWGVSKYKRLVFQISLTSSNGISDHNFQMCKSIVESVREIPKSK